METERKLDVLADIARALNQSGVTWAVGGSLLLYFKGKTGVFRDIDLMVCETDVEKLKQAMLPLGAPAPSNPNAQYRTRCFLEFTIRGVDVDVMAGFVILENGREHDCALSRSRWRSISLYAAKISRCNLWRTGADITHGWAGHPRWR